MKCLMVGERPEVRDGGWGAWSSWSKCSRTCGSGVAYAVRKCNHPSPSRGGSYCIGDRKRHKICATNVSLENIHSILANISSNLCSLSVIRDNRILSPIVTEIKKCLLNIKSLNARR